jgi:hypothetical protein
MSMRINLSAIFSLTTLLLGLFSTNCNAGTTYLCWIDAVEKTSTGLKVFLDSRYLGALKGIKRHSNGIIEQPKENSAPSAYFELQEGDTAGLSHGAHDWCEIKAEVQESMLGVQVEANSQPNGMPLTTASEFIVAQRKAVRKPK